MTPEQRELARKVIQARIGMWRSVAIPEALPECEALEAVLALLTPEAEADRRLGKAVRGTGVDSKTCAWLALRLRAMRGSLELSSPSYASAYKTEIAVFEAIAAALREDAGR